MPCLEVVMRTDEDVVEGELRGQTGVNGVEQFPRQRAARDVGLIGDDDQQKAAGLEEGEGFGHAGQNLELLGSTRRIGLAVTLERAVEHAVAVEKHGALQRRDSHLVGAAFTAGCVTNRCQTTAWKASACGVM